MLRWKSSACWRSRSTHTSRFSGSPEEGDGCVDGPDMIGECSLHRWSHAERLTCAADGVLPAVEWHTYHLVANNRSGLTQVLSRLYLSAAPVRLAINHLND